MTGGVGNISPRNKVKSYIRNFTHLRYMSEPSKRLSLFEESQTLSMARITRELQASGTDVINLTLGEPDFDTPEHIKAAAKKAIDDNFSHYTPVAGFPELREAISQKFKNDNGLTYSTDQVVVSTGAKHSIMNVVLSLVNPGDEVIIPSPYWVSYSAMVQFAEGIPVYVQSSISHDFKPTPGQVEKAITNKTKLFIFSNPCNPTGSVYSKDELAALAEVFSRHPQVFVVSDEIYEHIVFEGKHTSLASFENIHDRVITVNGLSKSFAMTGWRIGYIGAAKWIAKACEKLQGQFTSGTNSIAQRAAIAALTSNMKPTEEMRNAFLRRRNLILELIKAIPGMRTNVPGGAFYLFPDVSSYYGKSWQGETIKNSTDLCMYILNQAHVSLVTGDAFGSPDCIRISYATSEDKITEGMKRMAEALNRLS